MQQDYPPFGTPALLNTEAPAGYVRNARRHRQGSGYHIVADVAFFLRGESTLPLWDVLASEKGACWPATAYTVPGDSCIGFENASVLERYEALLKATAHRANNDPLPVSSTRGAGRLGDAA